MRLVTSLQSLSIFRVLLGGGGVMESEIWIIGEVLYFGDAELQLGV